MWQESDASPEVVITLMSSGVSRLLRSFLCTHRKLISTMPLALPRMHIVAGTAACTIDVSGTQRSKAVIIIVISH